MIIYALSSSDSPENIRYIGLTKKIEKIRLREHISESRYLRTHKDKWIQKVLRESSKILLSVIDTCEEYSQLREREKFWIAHYRSLGSKLTNGTDGGDSSHGYIRTPEQRIVNGLANNKPLYVFDYATKKLLYKFNSTIEAVRKLSLSKTSVSEVLRGNSNYHRTFTFSRTSTCPKEIIRDKRLTWNKGLKTKGTYKFKTSSVIISNSVVDIEFDTVAEASAYMGCSYTQISLAVKKGFYKKWKVAYLKKGGQPVLG